jgi:hypothetical protein
MKRGTHKDCKDIKKERKYYELFCAHNQPYTLSQTEEEVFPSSFYKSSITIISNPKIT